MAKIYNYVNAFKDMGFTPYADIAKWTTKGSLAEKGEALQDAAKGVATLAAENGLPCAPEKSEFLRIHNVRYESPGAINITLEDRAISETDKINSGYDSPDSPSKN